MNVRISDGVFSTIQSWPTEIHDVINSGLVSIADMDPHSVKPAPFPYAIGSGHVRVINVQYRDRLHFITAFFTYSDDLDEVHVTNINVRPRFDALAANEEWFDLLTGAHEEEIELPKRRVDDP